MGRHRGPRCYIRGAHAPAPSPDSLAPKGPVPYNADGHFELAQRLTHKKFGEVVVTSVGETWIEVELPARSTRRHSTRRHRTRRHCNRRHSTRRRCTRRGHVEQAELKFLAEHAASCPVHELLGSLA